VGFLIVNLVDGNGVDDFFAYTFELDVGSSGGVSLRLPIFQRQCCVYLYRAERRRSVKLDCGKVAILLTSYADPTKARGGTACLEG